MKVKICGIKNTKEAKCLIDNSVDFIGMVMFFEKSKRNIDESRAKEIIEFVKGKIKTVAVAVSPNLEQVDIIKKLGFDYIQIHGIIPKGIEGIDIIKAFNVKDMDELDKYLVRDDIKGILFDAPNPGSGTAFDWNILSGIKKGDKMLILAGGLTPSNVKLGIENVRPDMVDVSSGVEFEQGGKDPEKIITFVRNAKS